MLPDRSILIGQKLVENGKIEKLKFVVIFIATKFCRHVVHIHKSTWFFAPKKEKYTKSWL